MRIICHRNLFVIRQYSIRQPHQSVAAKTQEKSLITPVKSCMSKLTEISPGGNKEKGTRMRRLVSFCGRKFCVSIIIFVFFYMSAVAKNMGDSGQP